MIGGRLKELRLSRGMTQEELGRAVGVGKSAISQYENGAREPETAVLVQIAAYFQVTTDWLLGIDLPPADSVHEPGVRYEILPDGPGPGAADFLAELSRLARQIQDDMDRQALLRVARSMAGREASGGGQIGTDKDRPFAGGEGGPKERRGDMEY